MPSQCSDSPAVTPQGRMSGRAGALKVPRKGVTQLIMISVTRLNGVFLALLGFMSRLNQLRLRRSEAVLIVAVILATGVAQTQATKPTLGVSIAGVTRSAPGLVEIRYELRNQGSTDLYVPYIEVPGASYMTTLSLLHRTNEGALIALGPYYDVPSRSAKVLTPGQTLSLVDEASDPAGAITSGTNGSRTRVTVSLNGLHKLKIGYYSGSAAWQQWLKAAKPGKGDKRSLITPPMDFSFSEEFSIPPAGK